MGRKPVLGLVGACLASLALAGCEGLPSWPGGTKKDVTPPTNGGGQAWNHLPQSQSGSGSGGPVVGGPFGGAGARQTSMVGPSGSQTNPPGDPWETGGRAGGNDSFNVGAAKPTEPYPSGRSTDFQGGAGSGGLERVGYQGASGPDVRGVTALPTSTNFTDPNPGGLPPLSSRPALAGPGAGPGTAGLPALPPRGTPRIDEIPPVGATARGPVISPTMSPGQTTGGSPQIPPPAPVPGDPDLPVVPTPPVSQNTQSLRAPPLPAPALPRGMGVPTQLQNPAVMQPGGPNE